MGIFTRTVDIVNANVNALLDKAEDPEKLVRQMIHEMEQTLIEIKAACAGTMAGTRKLRRQEDEALTHAARWNERARRAVDHGRDDLAREALLQKRHYLEQAELAAKDVANLEVLEAEYKDDIQRLEEKLGIARERQRTLVQRHRRVQHKMRVETEIRRLDTSNAFMRFEELQYRLDRQDAESELVNYGRSGPRTLEQEFADLERDSEIEEELKAIKRGTAKAEPVNA